MNVCVFEENLIVKWIGSSLKTNLLLVVEIIEQYQPLLRKYEKDEKLVILEAEEESGTKPGQNYLSRVLRTKVSGTRGNGKREIEKEPGKL